MLLNSKGQLDFKLISTLIGIIVIVAIFVAFFLPDALNLFDVAFSKFEGVFG